MLFLFSLTWLVTSLNFQGKQIANQKLNWSVLSSVDSSKITFQEKQFLIFQGENQVGTFSSLFAAGKEWSWNGTLELNVHLLTFSGLIHSEFSLYSDSDRIIKKCLISLRFDKESFSLNGPSLKGPSLDFTGFMEGNIFKVSFYDGVTRVKKQFPCLQKHFLFNPIFPSQELFNTTLGISKNTMPACMRSVWSMPDGKKIPINLTLSKDSCIIDGTEAFGYRIQGVGKVLIYFSVAGELLGLKLDNEPNDKRKGSIFIFQSGEKASASNPKASVDLFEIYSHSDFQEFKFDYLKTLSEQLLSP